MCPCYRAPFIPRRFWKINNGHIVTTPSTSNRCVWNQGKKREKNPTQFIKPPIHLANEITQIYMTLILWPMKYCNFVLHSKVGHPYIIRIYMDLEVQKQILENTKNGTICLLQNTF